MPGSQIGATVNPSSAHAIYLEQLLSAYSQNPSAVRQQIRALLGETQQVDVCLNACVRVLRQYGDVELAQEAARRAFDLDRTNPVVAGMLGHFALNAGGYLEARDYFEIEAQLSPEAPEAWTSLARTCLFLLDTDRAAAAASTALRLAPESLDAARLRVDALILADQFELAVVACREQLARRPNDASLLALLCKALQRLPREEEAIAALEQLRDAAPDEPAAYLQLASVYERIGRIDQAHRVVAQGRSRGLDANAAFVQAVGNFCARQGETDAARQHYDNHRLRFGPSQIVELCRLWLDRRELVLKHCVDEATTPIGPWLTEAEQSRLAPMEYVEFATLVYGQRACASWTQLGLPSVLNSRGFDAVLRSRRVAWSIYTDAPSLPDLQDAISQIRALGITVLLNHRILDAAPQFRGLHRGLAVYDQVRRCARLRGQMIVAYADFIFGDGVHYLMEQLQSPGCLAITKPRVVVDHDAASLSKELTTGAFKNKNRTLVKRSFSEYLHPMTTGALRGKNGRFEISRVSDGYDVRYFRPPTIALAPDESTLSHMLESVDVENGGLENFLYAHDSHMLEWASARGNLKLVTDSDRFMFFEVTGAQERNNLRFFFKEAPSWEPPMAKALFEVECRWRTEDA